MAKHDYDGTGECDNDDGSNGNDNGNGSNGNGGNGISGNGTVTTVKNEIKQIHNGEFVYILSRTNNSDKPVGIKRCTTTKGEVGITKCAELNLPITLQSITRPKEINIATNDIAYIAGKNKNNLFSIASCKIVQSGSFDACYVQEYSQDSIKLHDDYSTSLIKEGYLYINTFRQNEFIRCILPQNYKDGVNCSNNKKILKNTFATNDKVTSFTEYKDRLAFSLTSDHNKPDNILATAKLNYNNDFENATNFVNGSRAIYELDPTTRTGDRVGIVYFENIGGEEGVFIQKEKENLYLVRTNHQSTPRDIVINGSDLFGQTDHSHLKINKYDSLLYIVGGENVTNKKLVQCKVSWIKNVLTIAVANTEILFKENCHAIVGGNDTIITDDSTTERVISVAFHTNFMNVPQ